jgi:DNA mismatch repair protein MutL
MVIVDQQRAHQRVLYEQFLTNITVHQASSQQLLFSNLYYSSVEMALISELKLSLQIRVLYSKKSRQTNI